MILPKPSFAIYQRIPQLSYSLNLKTESFFPLLPNHYTPAHSPGGHAAKMIFSNPNMIHSLLVHLQGSTRRLEVGVSVSVVDLVSKRSAVLGHFRVATTQYMLLARFAACVGPAGPGCIELPGRWLVLICEEGLVPPINTNSSDKRVRQSEATKEKHGEGKWKSGSLPPGSEKDRSSTPLSNSRIRGKSWRRGYPRH